MKIRTLTVGPVACNCAVVACAETGQAAIIDPGGNTEDILAMVKDMGVTVTHILHTHGHFDHILATGEVAAATGAAILIHRDDQPVRKPARPGRHVRVSRCPPAGPHAMAGGRRNHRQSASLPFRSCTPPGIRRARWVLPWRPRPGPVRRGYLVRRIRGSHRSAGRIVRRSRSLHSHQAVRPSRRDARDPRPRARDDHRRTNANTIPSSFTRRSARAREAERRIATQGFHLNEEGRAMLSSRHGSHSHHR
jgi:uncharacterized protein with GYD domain